MRVRAPIFCNAFSAPGTLPVALPPRPLPGRHLYYPHRRRRFLTRIVSSALRFLDIINVMSDPNFWGAPQSFERVLYARDPPRRAPSSASSRRHLYYPHRRHHFLTRIVCSALRSLDITASRSCFRTPAFPFHHAHHVQHGAPDDEQHRRPPMLPFIRQVPPSPLSCISL